MAKFKYIMRTEIALLLAISLFTILPLKMGMSVVGVPRSTVAAYYISSLLVIIGSYIAYATSYNAYAKKAATEPTWKPAMIGLAALIAVCAPWLSQDRFGVFDFTHLVDGRGLYSALMFAIGAPFINAIAMICLGLASGTKQENSGGD